MKFLLSLLAGLINYNVLSWICVVATSHAQSAPNVWDIVRQEFRLNHEITNPRVEHQLRWLISHPSFVQNLIRKSEPYIYHIVTEIKKRNLPGELALVPMIESSYDPFAYSGAGAAGLWQLMPGTATDLGLKQDWWFDGRRSIRPSTNAALNYLAYLHDYFNQDWLLAFAAYDAGEGAISRIIKQAHTGRSVRFWSLAVPQETRNYVPRLLALAEVIQNAERYHIELPIIPHLPYFAEVNIGSQIDLNHAAKMAGISYRDLIRLNPGFNRWATAPYRPYKLLIPANKVEDFSKNLANVPAEARVSWTRHKVSAGDNLMIIAKRYHTTVNLIRELNQLKSNHVSKGQYVLIPSSKHAPQPVTIPASPKKVPGQRLLTAKEYKVIHIVQRGETYAALEKRYDVTAQNIQAWNQLKTNSPLQPGQQLVIWKKARDTGVYTVKPGDNIAKIARQYHTNLRRLVQLNPGMNPFYLKTGQTIIIG